MSDFSATIKAILDTSGIEKQLRDIEKQYKIQFKFEPLDTSKLANQMNAAGASIGNRFASSFGKSAAPLIRTSLNEAIANMQSILRSANFDEGSISTIVKNLKDMNIEVGNLHTTVNNGDIKLSIRGVDELGRSVTIIKQFCAETSQISTVAMHIDQDFETSADAAKAFQKEVSSAFSTLKTKVDEINSLRVKLKGLDSSKNSSEIEQIQIRISQLTSECQNLYDVFGGSFSTEQINRLNDSLSKADSKISTLNGKMNDTSAAAAQNQNFELLYDTLQKINNLKIEKKRLELSGASEKEISIIDSQLEGLQETYNTLYDKSSAGLSAEQLEKINESLIKTVDEIDRLNTKSELVKQNLSEEITFKIDKGAIEADFKSVERGLNSLSEANRNAVKVYDDFNRAYNTLTSGESSMEDKIAAYKTFSDLLPIITKQVSNLTKEEQAAASAQKQIDEITFKIDKGAAEADFKSIEIMVDKAKSLGATLSGDVGKNYTELKSALDIMETKDGTVSIEQKIDAYKRFSDLLPIVRQQVSNLTKEEQAAAKGELTLTNSNKLSYNIQDWMNKNAKAAEVFGDRLTDLKDRLAGNKDPEELKKLTTEFAKIKSEAKASGLVTNSFTKSLKDTTKQVLGLTSTAAVIQKLIRVVKNMYQCVYDIDTAMTNLKKVTDETDKTYSAFLSRAAESAKNLGRTVSEMVTQVAEWSKLGYSLNEAEVLSKWSSIYANVGEVDEKTAVSDMVTAMKAFNIEASNAQTIVDSLNELGNNFAVSSADLGAGLSNSASAMNAAGTDMNKTLAMLTGGAEITQNAGEFGNFLKTASMRIRGMKGELEALGEEVDSNVDSISKVQTQILNLTHGKVNIFNDKGEFRDYYDIMKDIAGVVDSLTSTERASLYEILFGKVRSNQGAALIQAFQSGQIENAYNAALGSMGSAMEEQTKWIESLEGKTEQLKAAWQELSITLMNSDFLKGLIDAGKVILTVLNNIIENIGVLNTLLISLAAYKGIKSIS